MPDQPRALPPLGFRQVELSPAGWAAVAGPGLVVGCAAGLVLTRGRRRPAPLAVAGAAGALLGVVVARVVDELRWRRSSICLELSEPDAVLDLLQAVRAEGVDADMIRSTAPAGASAHYALRYRARDDRRVRAVLSAQQG